MGAKLFAAPINSNGSHFWAVLSLADTYSFYCSDINRFLIDYIWWEVRNIWLLFFENNSRSITMQEFNTTGGKILLLAVIIQDKVIDDNLKRANKIFSIFQQLGQKCLSFYPPFSLNIRKVINFEFFLGKQFFSWLCRVIYKLGWHFFIYHYWYISNFESTYKKPLLIKVAIFPDVILVSNYHACKGEAIKLIPYYMVDIIYKLQSHHHWKSYKLYKIYKT